jgi:hypothetical protein
LEWKSASLVPWFLILLSLNILDISFTNPSHEANPFTLLLWANIGLLPSACLKVGLVLLFGILCAIVRKEASPTDWDFAGRLLRGVLVALVAFYSFIVTWNLIVLL